MFEFLDNLSSRAQSLFFGEGEEVQRNLKVRLQDENATEINSDTKLRVQDGSKPAKEITVREYIGSPGADSKYNGMGDPSTRLNSLLTNHQYRHASNEAKADGQGLLTEPNGALVVPLQRPKVSVEVERSKVRDGDTVLKADNGALIVPTGEEHNPPAKIGNDSV